MEPPLLAPALRGLPRVLLLQIFTEPHSTKPREDCVGWGLETDAETLVATQLAPRLGTSRAFAVALPHRLPVLVIHGRDDARTALRFR